MNPPRSIKLPFSSFLGLNNLLFSFLLLLLLLFISFSLNFHASLPSYVATITATSSSSFTPIHDDRLISSPSSPSSSSSSPPPEPPPSSHPPPPPPSSHSPPPPPPSPPPPTPPPPPPTSPPPSPPRRRYPPIGLQGRCDVSKGKWVRDPAAPYYTNETCSAIQEHQNCMKFGRPDRGFLRWRWKPAACELPRFDAGWFLELVRGKSLAFVGDSLARNHMQSLMCLLSKVEYPQEISDGAADENVKRMFYASYNFTLSIFWSPFLVNARLVDADGPGHTGLWHLFLDEPDATWTPHAHRFDFLVVSTGNWFTRPALLYERGGLVGCHYCWLPNVPRRSPSYSHRAAVRTAFRFMAAPEGGFTGAVFLRTVSPSHFEGGEWNKGGDCRRKRPVRGAKARLEGLDREFYWVQMEEFRAAGEQAKGARMRVMDVTTAMAMRPDGHPSRYGHRANEKVMMYNDCVHWCLPGPVDMWSSLLFAMIGDESTN